MNYKDTIELLSQFDGDARLNVLLNNLSDSQFDASSLSILKQYASLSVEEVRLTLLQVGYELGDPYCVQSRIFHHLERKDIDSALMLADKHNATKNASIGLAVAAAYAASGDVLGSAHVTLNYNSTEIEEGYCAYASVVIGFMYISLQCIHDSQLDIQVSHDVNNVVLRRASTFGVPAELCAKTHNLTIHIDVIYQALASFEAYCEKNMIPIHYIKLGDKSVQEVKSDVSDTIRQLGTDLLTGSEKEKIEKIEGHVKQLTLVCNQLSEIQKFITHESNNEKKH
ncbi:hypothetical protein LMH73_011080 [Vibrio splendidus]|nr:hypothetical protein [Vibrio splendidus]MCC4880769.1 hypothetical protein [Vibrio splendidus]